MNINTAGEFTNSLYEIDDEVTNLTVLNNYMSIISIVGIVLVVLFAFFIIVSIIQSSNINKVLDIIMNDSFSIQNINNKAQMEEFNNKIAELQKEIELLENKKLELDTQVSPTIEENNE